MRIVVITHVTLDGVMQGPGRPDEDTRDGFTHGGWAAARSDTEIQQAWGERLTRSSGFLFGRRTYEDVLGYWNTQDSPFKEALNQAAKYVASTGTPTLKWPNSTLLTGDVHRGRHKAQGHPRQRPPHHGQRRPHPLTQRPRPHRRVPAVHSPDRPGPRTPPLRRRFPARRIRPHPHSYHRHRRYHRDLRAATRRNPFGSITPRGGCLLRAGRQRRIRGHPRHRGAVEPGRPARRPAVRAGRLGHRAARAKPGPAPGPGRHRHPAPGPARQADHPRPHGPRRPPHRPPGIGPRGRRPGGPARPRLADRAPPRSGAGHPGPGSPGTAARARPPRAPPPRTSRACRGPGPPATSPTSTGSSSAPAASPTADPAAPGPARASR